MIRLNIELWPHGDENAKSIIHTVDIANCGPVIGQENTDLRKYKVALDDGEWMEGVNHYRSQNIFVLLHKVMEILK